MIDTVKRKDLQESELLCIARSVDLPEWASHIAVRTDGSKAEPAVWSNAASAYVDENPARIPDDIWIGSYVDHLWVFFSRGELNT